MPSVPKPPQALAYTVRAEHPSGPSADRYLAWLVEGHLRAVLAGGAVSAQAVRLDPDLDGDKPVVEARYVFPDRLTFESYLEHHAPRLRAEGLALFGPASGVRFTRSTGDLHTPAN